MKAVIIIAIIVLLVFVAIGGMAYILNYSDNGENQCLQDYMEEMKIEQCYYDEYVEGGFDSPEECLLHYMNRLPDC